MNLFTTYVDIIESSVSSNFIFEYNYLLPYYHLYNNLKLEALCQVGILLEHRFIQILVLFFFIVVAVALKDPFVKEKMIKLKRKLFNYMKCFQLCNW